MHFEWDRSKAETNRRKHKVTFDEAVSVFYDALSATFPDPDSSPSEERLVTIGQSSRGRLLVVVHAEQDEIIRIISARLATAHERKRHES
ncbi:MAG: BrnT family toxin [Betaproteobacteria bacterium]|nr:MAG: BrnT family toxin [Betaproteobacteria bacterium]TMH58557.1 MAG: BrnT family toxin [Betaproteobacteria bacterium]TMH77598.1 MAG: BrnT family toxin [Betaproteobacteria bacterium]